MTFTSVKPCLVFNASDFEHSTPRKQTKTMWWK